MNTPNPPVVKKLIRVMRLHAESLKAAKCNPALLRLYDDVIDFIEHDGERIFTLDARVPSNNDNDVTNEEKLVTASLSHAELYGMLSRPEISRRTLERIAVVRFGVPQGSLRKWGTKESLRDKNLTMLRNENIHSTIREVAKSNSGRSTKS